MQPVTCSELRVVVFDAYNPLDLADEVNLWLKSEGETSEGETMEVIDWSYHMGVDYNQKNKQGTIHSMALCCRKIGIKP